MRIFIYLSLLMAAVLVGIQADMAYRPVWPENFMAVPFETINQEQETFSKARIILSRNPEDQSARDYILRHLTNRPNEN